MTSTDPNDRGEVILYRTADGRTALDVRLAGETVWLTLNQMGELFGRDKSVISRHLRNVFDSKELTRKSVVAKNATATGQAKINDNAKELMIRPVMNLLVEGCREPPRQVCLIKRFPLGRLG